MFRSLAVWVIPRCGWYMQIVNAASSLRNAIDFEVIIEDVMSVMLTLINAVE